MTTPPKKRRKLSVSILLYLKYACTMFEYNPLPIEESGSSTWKLCKSGKAEAKKALVLHINNENCNLCQSEICPVCRNSDERTPYVLLNAKMSNSHDEHCPKGTNQVYLDHWF